jgi:hypothetical protein
MKFRMLLKLLLEAILHVQEFLMAELLAGGAEI